MPAVGLEPTRVMSPTDFESVTSANSITPARCGFAAVLLYQVFRRCQDKFAHADGKRFDGQDKLCYNKPFI